MNLNKNHTILLLLTLTALFSGISTLSAHQTEDTILDAFIIKPPHYECTTKKSCVSIITTDKETLRNEDTKIFKKNNSAYLHGKLKQGDLCDIRVTGLALKAFSIYRNITNIQCNASNVTDLEKDVIRKSNNISIRD